MEEIPWREKNPNLRSTRTLIKKEQTLDPQFFSEEKNYKPFGLKNYMPSNDGGSSGDSSRRLVVVVVSNRDRQRGATGIRFPRAERESQRERASEGDGEGEGWE
ncbi:hypothetical protein RHGRI_029305 [Rhododendron griersonianum]|uniref:Uncharacterized protein n=1 Tax=Rhododendron griersonianum TaxID=479676 RepID=A0AAV6IL24_9ERIC|nr:hypothetical protein RHGRI_029305 [Rhododendron griersonianum]